MGRYFKAPLEVRVLLSDGFATIFIYSTLQQLVVQGRHELF